MKSSRPRNVSVSITDTPEGEIKVWCATFTIPGSLKRTDGKVDEADRLAKQKKIQQALERLVISEE